MAIYVASVNPVIINVTNNGERPILRQLNWHKGELIYASIMESLTNYTRDFLMSRTANAPSVVDLLENVDSASIMTILQTKSGAYYATIATGH
jgi:hypothetical protein